MPGGAAWLTGQGRGAARLQPLLLDQPHTSPAGQERAGRRVLHVGLGKADLLRDPLARHDHRPAGTQAGAERHPKLLRRIFVADHGGSNGLGIEQEETEITETDSGMTTLLCFLCYLLFMSEMR